MNTNQDVGSFRPNIYLFTNTYPFGGEPFLHDEVPLLSKRCNLILIPTAPIQPELKISLSNVSIDDRLGNVLRSSQKDWKSTKHLLPVFRDLVCGILKLPRTHFQGRVVLQFLKYLIHFRIVNQWVNSVLKPEVCLNSSVIYCYWLAHNFYAAAKPFSNTGIPIIARAHAYDLYTDRSAIGYNLFQSDFINIASCVCPISKHGMTHLQRTHPTVASTKFHLSYLGTSPPLAVNLGSTDGTFRVVSCSRAVPIKRLDLIASVMEDLAVRLPSNRFEWTYVGFGPEFERLKARTLANHAENLKIHLLGEKSKEEINKIYSNAPFDLFLNLSEAEGLPVSMMEASSHGIPIAGTDVGGSREIIEATNGLLLPANSSSEDVSGRLTEWVESRLMARHEDAQLCHSVWHNHFSADTNYRNFIEQFLCRTGT